VAPVDPVQESDTCLGPATAVTFPGAAGAVVADTTTELLLLPDAFAACTT
jgi:hypothetical protein